MPMENLACNLTLHDYQKGALNKWLQTKNGALVLPTGAGKTVVGIEASG